MSNTTLSRQAKQESTHRTGAGGQSFDFLWPLLCLVIIETVAFGINVSKAGIYQDEWLWMGELHFVPHTIASLFSNLFWDPRIIVRPVGELYYAGCYFFAWEKPFLYHLVCYTWEAAGGVFLYLAASRLCRNHAVGLAAAVLFLLYPNHDSTHYDISVATNQVSISLYTLSLWLFLKGIDDNRGSLIWWSGFAYFLSVWTYEQTLPLVVLYPVLSLLAMKPEQLPPRAFKTFVAYQIPAGLVVASMLAYRVWVLPSLALGWHYSTVVNPQHFVQVIVAGINCSFSPYIVQFCGSLIGESFRDGISAFSWGCLALAIGSTLFFTFRADENSRVGGGNLKLIVAGIVTLLFSYTIFGFSTEHKPVIDAWLNRVNVGGSLGACFIIAGLLGMLRDALNAGGRQLGRAVLAGTVAILAGLLILVDWQFAQPWIVSWKAQKELMSTIKRHAAEIKPGDSIILGGITRYVRWAPVADGTWDFQNLVQTTLNDNRVMANVITPRTRIEEDKLMDRSGILVLGAHPYRQMILYSPDKGQWVRISTREEFIERAREFGWTVAEGKPGQS